MSFANDPSLQHGLNEEDAAEACRGILYHLLSQVPHPTAGTNWERKRALLLADYARRSADLPPELQIRMDRAAITSFVPINERMSTAELAKPVPGHAKVDVAIITIIQEELKATLQVFGLTETPQAMQPFYRTSVPCAGRPDRSLDVVITSAPKPLNVHVGIPVAHLRNQYSPRAIFLVGIAGGRAGKAAPGSVVVAQRVFYYEPGRVTTQGTDPRPQWADPRNTYGNGLYSYDPRETSFFAKIRTFIENIPEHHRPSTLPGDHRPEVHLANTTIAAGEQVFRDGKMLEDLAKRFDDTIHAADQESYGFATAARDLPWAIFRGISDNADPTQDDRWKYTAAGFAAVCLRDFLETYYVPPDVADL